MADTCIDVVPVAIYTLMEWLSTADNGIDDEITTADIGIDEVYSCFYRPINWWRRSALMMHIYLGHTADVGMK